MESKDGEARGIGAEVSRDRKFEIGNLKFERKGGEEARRKLEIGNWKIEKKDREERKSQIGNWKLEIENWKIGGGHGPGGSVEEKE